MVKTEKGKTRLLVCSALLWVMLLSSCGSVSFHEASNPADSAGLADPTGSADTAGLEEEFAAEDLIGEMPIPEESEIGIYLLDRGVVSEDIENLNTEALERIWLMAEGFDFTDQQVRDLVEAELYFAANPCESEPVERDEFGNFVNSEGIAYPDLSKRYDGQWGVEDE